MTPNEETFAHEATDPGRSLPRVIATGKIFAELGVDVDCYVLEDNRRVISQRGMLRAIRNAAKTGGHGRSDLGQYLSRLPERFRHLEAITAIEFLMPDGKTVALGREGHFFIDLCDAYADAFVAGELHPSQEKFGRTAIGFLRVVAKIGIDALIDEATGHERSKAERELSRRFATMFRADVGKWDLRWPPSLVHAMAPLYGIRYTGGSYPRGLQTPFHDIYVMIFGKEGTAEMRRRNPNPDNYCHTQILKDQAKVVLSDELAVVELLAKQSRTKDEFWARMATHYQGAPLQTTWVN